MSIYGYLSRDQLSTWLDILIDQATVIAPRWIDGVLLYRPVSSSADVAWEYSRPVSSIKEYFFPATETLFKIEKISAQIKLTETLPTGRQVLFGVRPCDARGIRMLDALFLDEDPVDPYFAERRENSTMIGLTCHEPGETCFCTSLGGAPDDPADMDLMLYEVDGKFRVEVMTEKGQCVARQMIPEGVLANDERPMTDEISNHSSFVLRPLSTVNVPEIDAWPAFFEDPYWEQMAERCLSCRICAYVCPTCRCFDVRDETYPDGSMDRVRCWDSCAGPVYRRIAGGHNPRATKGERLRNRFFCKFNYYPRQYGVNSAACTGCGRCIEYCPVSIDVTEVLAHLSEQTVGTGESGEM